MDEPTETPDPMAPDAADAIKADRRAKWTLVIAGVGAVIAIAAFWLALDGRSQNQSQEEVAAQVREEFETQIQDVSDSLASDTEAAASAKAELQEQLDAAAKERRRLSNEQSVTQEDLEQQADDIDTVTKMAETQKQEIAELQGQVTDLESTVSTLEDQVSELEKQAQAEPEKQQPEPDAGE